MPQLSVPSTWQKVVIGAIILVASATLARHGKLKVRLGHSESLKGNTVDYFILNSLGILCDVTLETALQDALEQTVRHFDFVFRHEFKLIGL